MDNFKRVGSYFVQIGAFLTDYPNISNLSNSFEVDIVSNRNLND